MSGPRRHGSRLVAASSLFVLLVLAFALVRGTAASATKADARAKRAHHTSGHGNAVTKVGTRLGKTVDSVLDDLATLLGNTPDTATAPPPTTAPPTTAPPTSAPRTTTPAPRPTASTPSSPAPRPTSSPERPPVSGTSHRPVTSSPGQPPPRNRSASPVRSSSAAGGPASSSDRRDPPESRTTQISVLGGSAGGIPGLDVTTALSALMVAMVLGVGLIVYRAGYRGERAH